MYKTKNELDAHVRKAFSKIRSENERNIRGFTIAKLYFKINEYTAAEQYLLSHLSVKENNDQAHKLLGQCYLHMKKPEKALQSFQRSLQLNSKQPDVLVEVCQLFLEDKNLNANKARYWCDLAESEKVQHDAVFSLRLQLLNKDNQPERQVEDMIQKEIAARPNDVQLRVRLVRNYIENNMILDAFKYVYNLEMTQNEAFVCSTEWYTVVWLLLSKYEQMPNTKKDWEFWLLLTICLERQVYISYSVSSGNTGAITETANLLFNLDQYLYKITQLSGKFSAQKELVALFLDHYCGQLLMHAVSLIVKRELLQNKNKWKETIKSILPLLLLSFQIKVPDNNEPWMKHCNEEGKLLVQLWNREGCFRCAQAGRILLSCLADDSVHKENPTLQVNNLIGSQSLLWSSNDELLAQIRQTCSDKQWRRNIFAMLFCNSDQKVKDQSSLLIKNPKLLEPLFELPTYGDVERFEETAQYLQPQSLQHMVYLCLGNDNLAYVRAKYFNGLNFSTQNLSFCGAESLNQLDVETFLYAATIQARRMLEVERDTFDNYNSGNRSAVGRPRILPFVNLRNQLCTEEQIIWWKSMYRVYKNLSCENLAELRANLQFGIETVRGINGPKMDMIIVFKLGQIFVARAQDIVKQVDKAFLESRADNLYKYGLNMLKMNNRGVLEPFRKYFKYAKASTSAVERQVSSLAEDAVSYLAARYFKKSEYEDLIEEFQGIQLPFATYLQAEAYRKLDEADKTPKKVKRIYLDRAVECLNQTLTLLNSGQIDANHPLNSVIHSELKRLQQATNKFHADGVGFGYNVGFNNSSTYEDAECDFADSPVLPVASGFNRTRRETATATLVASPRNNELENLVKQMANTLSFVKEEIVDTIKPEVVSMRKEISSLKDKIANLEDAMKKTRISSNPPSRDDAMNVLDEIYMIEDALHNQIYPQQSHNNIFPPVGSYNTQQTSQQQQQQLPPQQQQPRINTPNAMQMQQNAVAAVAAAAYNSPMFNPNYPMNYYTPPYMMTPQAAAVAAAGGNAILGQRNQLPMPYIEGGNMNFNVPTQPQPQVPTTPLLPQAHQEGRPSNLYNLLTNSQTTQIQPLPQLQPILPLTSIATGPSAQFNKAINNQPVEKGPPANVVITNSDPLPNPNKLSLQAQQPTLSVTIPSHHIKSSHVQTPDTVPAPFSVQPSCTATSNTNSNFFSGFGLNTSTANNIFTALTNTAPPSSTSIFANSSNTNSSKSIISSTPSSSSSFPTATTTISSTTFSFKPQIAQAQAVQAAAAAITADDSLNNTNESGAFSEISKSGTDVEPEYDPRPDFKPIIPLPDEIEVKTGEEEEEVMFNYRAKLYRFSEKEWKERGIGNIKILKGKDGASRILMRRDQTHKICANHKITKNLILTTPKDEKKSGAIWCANDFADEEVKLEKFFVRFKMPETAQQFIEAFRRAQKEDELLKAKKESGVVAQSLSRMEEKSQKPTAAGFEVAKSVTMKFATSTPSAKAEIAEKNENSKQNNAHVTAPDTNKTTPTAISKFLFDSKNLSSNKTEPAQKQGNSPFANFSFDKPATFTSINTGTTSASTATTTASPFGNIFGKTTSQASPFSSLNLPAFPKTTSTTAAVTSTNTTIPTVADTNLNNSQHTDDEDDYVPTAQFNPVIPLPNLIEVTTGEENEIVLFEHRAKLLRYDKEAADWKERGLGNIKLLQDSNDKNKVRLVMRREHVHKLCCNQRLYKDTSFVYAKNSQTALTWAGQDYSDNELITEMLTIRFKTPEICNQFHEAVLQAQSNMTDEAQICSTIAKDPIKKQPENNVQEKCKGFGDSFRPKPGSWSCQSCYVQNPADKLYCTSCEAPKDDTVPKSKASTNTLLKNPPKTVFSFGFPESGISNTTTNTTTQSAFAFSNNVVTVAPAISTSISTFTTAVASTSTSTNSFGDQFKPKPGAWDCNACYLSNTANNIYCKACDEPKDDTVPKKETKSSVLALSNPEQKFTFGFADLNATTTKPATGFVFGATPTTMQSQDTKGVYGNLGNNANVDATSKSFNFATPAATSTVLNGSLNAKPKFSFTSDKNGIGDLNSEATLFSLDKKDFSFTLKPKSPGKSGKSPIKFGGAGGDADGSGYEGEDGEYHEDEEENNTYFTPVIPLPDKIDVKTGEEDEDVLYVHRAKLYRFVNGEWKERGLGDIKILRHKHTGKLRVVMRREQILKICLNHMLNADIDYKRKDDKTWLFVVHDFSEGEVELQKFSLRFKSKDIAEEFMEAVQIAIAGTAVAIDTTCSSTVANTSTSNATASLPPSLASYISEANNVIPDELKLHYEFFMEKPTCPGCDGCNSETFVFPTLKSNQSFLHKDDVTNPLTPLEMPVLSLPKSSNSLLKQSVLSPAVSFAASDIKLNNTIFSGYGGANSTTMDKLACTTFSFTAALNESTIQGPNENKPSFGGFLFGSSAEINNCTPKFGDKPAVFGGAGGSIFGGNSSAVKSANLNENNSIFGGNATFNSTVATGAPQFGNKNVFGSSTPSFDVKSNTNTNNPTKSIFGNISANTTQSGGNGTGNSIFGLSAVVSSFGSGSGMQSSLFSADLVNKTDSNVKGSFVFAGTKPDVESVNTFADLSSKAGGLDFASLAAKANTSVTSATTTMKAAEKTNPTAFIGLTNQDAFSNFNLGKNKNSSLNEIKSNDDNTDESNKSVENVGNANDENYDPHYDPVIALPDEIVVSTGEENEEKIFGERAVLYRWDGNTKEWKERGVGELKVLAHRANKTYRMIMRREQIHKLVLNHAITDDFTFHTMKNNPKCYVWGAMNYVEAGKEGELEKLAARFKNEELAKKFCKQLTECVEAAKGRTEETED